MEEQKSFTENPDFQHGYSNGLEDVDKQTYEGYLSSQVHVEWLQQQLQQKKQELHTTDERIEQRKTRYKQAFDSLQDKLLKISLASKQKERLEAELFDLDESQHSLQKKRLASAHTYSLFAGIVYFVAGVAFVTGDLIISHEIVAYALNIHNTNEAWAFAVGLAMISVLLKPAYERLIESPYSEQRQTGTPKSYIWFKGITVAFALATLFVLGWFRYEAYKADKAKEHINRTIKSLNNQVFDPLNPTAPPPPAIQAQIEQKMREFDSINQQLINSGWALASFVLSGLLFALAGAICLGIAFPVLQCYWYRWLQIDPQLRRLHKKRQKLMPLIQAEETTLSENIVQKNILEHELQLDNDQSELVSQQKDIIEDIKYLQEQLRLAQTDARIASYNDGFGKGSMVRDAINQDELQQFVRENYFNISNLATKAKNASPEKALYSRRSSLRPYQQLRKLISDDFSSEGEI